MAVDDAVDTYVSCCSIGRKTTKVFNYIQPRPSAKSATSGSSHPHPVRACTHGPPQDS